MASHFDRQYCGHCGLTYMFENPGAGADAGKADTKGKKKK